MDSSSDIRGLIEAGGACLTVALLTAGCHDAANLPTAILVAEEARSVLVTTPDLPTLPRLAARAELADELEEPLRDWELSWGHEPARARELRSGAYAGAGTVLAERLGASGVRAVHERVGEALSSAEGLGEEEFTADGLGERLAEARLSHGRAARALEEGRAVRALTLSLEAADAVHRVGPEGVSRLLLARAERGLERIRSEGGGDERTLERGERLIRGARRALDQEEWSRAVRRAFYACQVLGISPR